MTGTAHGSTMRGVLYGMAAGALWGLVFLAPDMASAFSPLQLAAGRYLVYGVISAMLIARRWRAMRGTLQRRDWLALAWLALVGNTLYYALLSSAVQTGGIAMTSLIIGFLPVAVTIAGSQMSGAVPLKRLLPSLLLCSAGVICIGMPAARAADHQWIGLLCAVGALASWTLFAIGNRAALARLPDVSAHDWNLLTGVVTGLQSLLLIPAAVAFGSLAHDARAWAQFAGVSIAVAVLASLIGNAFWNRMSRLLPLTLVGQMILFETLFALIYGFIWEQRLPTVLEITAFALVVSSVLACIHAHRPQQPSAVIISPPSAASETS